MGVFSFSNGLLEKNFCLRVKHWLGVDRSGQTRSPMGVVDPGLNGEFLGGFEPGSSQFTQQKGSC